MVDNAQEIFRTLYESGLHKRNNNGKWVNWPQITYCLLRINIGDNEFRVKTTKSDEGVHAEIKALNVIKLNLNQNEDELITIFMNYSPCRECAETLKEFVEQNGYGIRLHIYFVQLYKVQRLSCQNASDMCCQPETHYHEIGLRELAKTVTIEPFTPKEWGSLAILLLLEKDGREKEDKEVLGDLNDILGHLNIY